MKSISNDASQVFEVDQFVMPSGLTVKKYRLSNGLKVIILQDPSAPVFAYHTWFNVGSRNEKEGTTGIAHLFEHLLFKETTNHKEGSFDKLLEEQGGRVNAGTYLDWTFYTGTLPKEAFDLAVTLEADRMQNMILSDKQVNSEREVVANERRFRVDNSPSGTMYEALYKTAFSVHPYHWPIIGWMKDIEAIKTSDCVAFYKTYYSPNNATVVIAGDVDPAHALKKIQEAYGSIPPAKIPEANLPKEPPQSKERRTSLELAIPSEKLLVAYRSVEATHSDYTNFEVAHAVLFDGRSSRLYRRLVAETQIAAEAGGWVNQTKDPGLYIIDVSLQPGRKAEEAEKVISEEIAKLARELVPAKELEKVKNRLETSFWRNFTTSYSKAYALGFTETVLHDYRLLFSEVERYRTVTPEDIQRVAKTYLLPERRTIVVARPQKAAPKT